MLCRVNLYTAQHPALTCSPDKVVHTRTHAQMHTRTRAVVWVQAAEARERWREEQGALSFQMPEAKVRVVEPHSPHSRVQVRAGLNGGGEQSSQRLVSELMILAGQAIACMGQTPIPLPALPYPQLLCFGKRNSSCRITMMMMIIIITIIIIIIIITLPYNNNI